jgi:hypothetical protein
MGGRDAQSCRGRADVRAAVPYGKDEARIPDGQGAGEMDRVRAARGVPVSERARVLSGGRGELDRADGRRVFLPGFRGGLHPVLIEVVAAARAARTSGQAGSPRRHRGRPAVPGQVAAGLLGAGLTRALEPEQAIATVSAAAR